MLRRFADARLRADLAREIGAKKKAQYLARAKDRQLKAVESETGTLRAQAAQWQGIARQAKAQRDNHAAQADRLAAELFKVRDQLAAERARTQETSR